MECAPSCIGPASTKPAQPGNRYIWARVLFADFMDTTRKISAAEMSQVLVLGARNIRYCGQDADGFYQLDLGVQLPEDQVGEASVFPISPLDSSMSDSEDASDEETHDPESDKTLPYVRLLYVFAALLLLCILAATVAMWRLETFSEAQQACPRLLLNPTGHTVV